MRSANSGRRLLAATCLCLVNVNPSAWARDTLDLEAALVTTGYNDVAVPGNSGTRFSLSDDLDAQAVTSFRLRYGHELGERHWLGLLIAPLRVDSQGSLPRDVDFNGSRFAAGKPTSAEFRFDSYRLIYRYRLIDRETLRLHVGGALKLRDASIRLRSGDTQAEKANTGLVPLLSLRLRWQVSERLHGLIDGEALAAPQGRAEDLLLALGYTVNEALSLRLGYRLLEGGADNDEVYTFSLFHQYTVGLSWSFPGL